uniref:Uncharacterized protein n=1 Tax=Leersia perrieri TaxID=77586 RepID=A0A0D9WQB1_9ORYZ
EQIHRPHPPSFEAASHSRRRRHTPAPIAAPLQLSAPLLPSNSQRRHPLPAPSAASLLLLASLPRPSCSQCWSVNWIYRLCHGLARFVASHHRLLYQSTLEPDTGPWRVDDKHFCFVNVCTNLL